MLLHPIKIDTIYLEIVASCNLRCAMCPQGDLEKVTEYREKGIMPVDVFNRVISYLLKKGILEESIHLYNWGEPFLHPQLDQILQICREKNIKVVLSSNLSVPTSVLEVLKDNVIEALYVSVSGFSHNTYQRNHIQGDFGLVYKNLELLKEYQNSIRRVIIKYLVFKYNLHEIQLAKSFAQENGMHFFKHFGKIPSVESFFLYLNDRKYRKIVDDFIVKESIELEPTKFCPQERVLAINNKAEIELCCAAWNRSTNISVFDADISEHLNNKINNEFCAKCLNSGFSYYTHLMKSYT